MSEDKASKPLKAGLAAGIVIIALCLAAVTIFSLQWKKEAKADGAGIAETAAFITPKYIFLFIGDGMSYPQITLASNYLGGIEYGDSEVKSLNLSFMDFPVAGTATTYDLTSFIPDSAAAGTAISTGHKTNSGEVGMDAEKGVGYETIAEKLKKQLGYKIGIVSSAFINDATPAAFYAHQPSRRDYYEIAVELTESGFDYFGGGGILQPIGAEGDKKDIIEIAAEKGYSVYNTRQSILGLDGSAGKVIAVNPVLDSSAYIPYAIDETDESLTLAQFTQKGIDVLDNETGFFIMVEGGRIDGACHANDAATAIRDVFALADAVEVAVNFALEHGDTLIIVTGDHETGGLTTGFAATGYNTYYEMLSNQKMSYYEYNKRVERYRDEGYSFEAVLDEIEVYFGLSFSGGDEGSGTETDLSPYEINRLEEAYNASMASVDPGGYSEEEYILYGPFEPLTITVLSILNNKAGLNFSSYSHTALPVPVFALGPGEDLFTGYYDNTDIFKKLQKLTSVQ